MIVNNEAMDNVVALMVEDAAELYVNAAVNIMRIRNGKRQLKHPERTIKECLDTMTEVTLFFCSDYGEGLTGFEGKVVMEQLNKRAKEVYETSEDKHPRYRVSNKRACCKRED